MSENELTRLRYDLNIPGWMSERDLTIIAQAAKSVRTGGKIAEIGGFLGRTTFAIAQSCDPTVTVYVVDPWEWLPHDYGADQPGGPINPEADAFELFNCYTRDCSNVIPLRGRSPAVHPPVPNEGFDFVFIDGDHHSPGFDADVDFYFAAMAPRGVLMGDDYSESWPDVVRYLHSFADRKSLQVRTLGDKLWMLVRRGASDT